MPIVWVGNSRGFAPPCAAAAGSSAEAAGGSKAMKLSTWFGYDAGGSFLEVYTDDDDASGYGDHPMVGRWYGPRAECLALDPATVPLYPKEYHEGSDPFDLACERRHD